MIKIKDISDEKPYTFFVKLYDLASKQKQTNIDAAVISTYCDKYNAPDSRIVNIKYLIDKNLIFFSNYSSVKAGQFSSNNTIAMLFFWDKINVQIRLRGSLKKCSNDFSDYHWASRSQRKNILSISSNQSKKIDSYEKVVEEYETLLKSNTKYFERPSYWGGYSFCPQYFEFWEGHADRINKRTCYESSKSGQWNKFFLQP